MKYAFAVASILAVSALADVLIADDSGFNPAVVAVDSGTGLDKFKADWGVNTNFGTNEDPEDGTGYQMDSTYYYTESTMAVPDLSKNVLSANDELVFTIKVVGQWPDFSDTYDIKLCANIDGFAREDKISGIALETDQDFTLSLRTNKSIDVKDIKIVIGGQDSEYWAGTYGAFFKDMKLVFKTDGVDMLTDESNWGVDSSTAIAIDDADGQGSIIVFSYDMDSVSATVNESDFDGKDIDWNIYNRLIFDVNVAGSWPEYNDTWKLKITGKRDGSEVWSEYKDGTGTEKYVNVHYEWDLFALGDFNSITVTLSGDDSEYWAGNYGPRFQGMHLYVAPGDIGVAGTSNVDLLTDQSNWHVDSSSAIAVDDGKAIVFSYFMDSVYADAFQSDFEGLNIDWDALTQLNFDVNVVGSWPEYQDPWKIQVEGKKDGAQVWSDSRDGTGTEAYEAVHFQWDAPSLNGGDFDQITVTLSGDDSEYWSGNYGAKFEGMHLYLSPPSGLMLAKAAATEAETSSSGGFGYGFLAGFGATAAICGLAAYGLGSRKQSSIEDPFLRV